MPLNLTKMQRLKIHIPQNFSALYIFVDSKWMLCFSGNFSIESGVNVQQTINSLAEALKDEGLDTKIIEYTGREAVPLFIEN